MKQLVTLSLMCLTLFSTQVFGIDIKRGQTTHQGRPRMPSMTRIEADYENEVLNLRITGYTGDIQIYITDGQGNVILYKLSSVISDCNFSMNLKTLPKGCYTLNIVLGNATYYGYLNV